MAAVFDVWICKPGDACQVDDGDWVVTIFDARGDKYQWAGITYADLPAPHAHWSGTIPPGCYVVQARQRNVAKNPLVTDHAIACVGCDGLACVRLYVAGEPADGSCKITIKEVIGVGVPTSPVPTSIEVTGTAVNCQKIQVSLSCAGSQAHTSTVSVSSQGDWTSSMSNKDLGCRCRGPVAVVARCVEHPKCEDTFQADHLNCRQSK